MLLRCLGAIGECDARTQVSAVCRHTGETEDAGGVQPSRSRSKLKPHREKAAPSSAPRLGDREARLAPLRRLPLGDRRGSVHEHHLRVPARLHPARRLPPPYRRRRLRRGRRGHLRLALAVDDHDRLHLQLVGSSDLADPGRLHHDDRPPAAAEPAAVLARLRPRPGAVPLPVPRPAAVRPRRARLRAAVPDAADALAFVVSLALAVVVSFGFRFIYNSVAFWLLDFRGVVTLSSTRPRSSRAWRSAASILPRLAREIACALPFAR